MLQRDSLDTPDRLLMGRYLYFDTHSVFQKNIFISTFPLDAPDGYLYFDTTVRFFSKYSLFVMVKIFVLALLAELLLMVRKIAVLLKLNHSPYTGKDICFFQINSLIVAF